MRVAWLLAAALVGLTGCAEVRAFWNPPKPATGPGAPAASTPPPPAASGAASGGGAAAPGTSGGGTTAGGSGTPGPPAGPALTLQMPADEERRLRDGTQRKLDETERILRPLASQPLQPRQREMLLLAQNFVEQAKKALAAQEYERAANLTTKARTLADDLAAGK
jgi:hypothetical protein